MDKLYKRLNRPITYKDLSDDIEIPTLKVFNRNFGSWKNACDEKNIPYARKEAIVSEGKCRIKDRTGEEFIGKNGYIWKIVKYINANNVVAECQDKHRFRTKTTYSNLKKSNIKNPYHKDIYGVACIGNATSKINSIKKKSYMVWYSMIQRCYFEAYNNKPTYLDCFVCDEWLCYENFERWFDENYYCIENEMMSLDKDILLKGNRIYSPNTCIFVPQTINVLFENRNVNPIKYDEKSGRYITLYQYSKHGYYNNKTDAFMAYKKYREQYIKDIAEKYKDKIPEKLYRTLYSYTLEEDDLD